MINFRNCTSGEQLSDDSCIPCPPGKYTFEYGSQDCESCPLEAFCEGGDVMNVKSGYWRSKFDSSNIMECFNTDACM